MNEKTINFPVIFHFHQPVDNFQWVIDDCFRKAYGPLVDNLYKFPEIKICLHVSGNLLEWFLENKPDFIKKLKAMAKRGQIEIIGGGYYEPIYAVIPHSDRIAQIKKLTELIQKEFGLEVKGAWLSERVWEPDYPSFLVEAGLKYIVVDDNHFRSCGLTEEETLYSYTTEDEGKSLRVFPINEQIRYWTPWKPTYLTIDYLRKMADEKGNRIALMISDAEKMGVWGTTHEICYVDGYGHQEGDNGKPFIPTFLNKIVNNNWIKTITLSEYMEIYPAKGLIYLPTSSYDKMEEWVLPTETRKKFEAIKKAVKDDALRQDELQFLRGGFWRYFLVKYPESNNMHKKMLYVRDKLIQVEEKVNKLKDVAIVSKAKEKLKVAWDEIYKSQCNDSYWHGLFGGVYLHFLRFSVYTHLINAEKLVDEINALILPFQQASISIIPMDFYKDSKKEFIIESEVLNVYINPSDCGTIFELDYKPKSYNLQNVLTRWLEAYHENEKIKTGEIMVDRFKRSMLRLRFLHDDVSFNQLQADKYYEFGDFINGEFKVVKSEKSEKTAVLEMEKKGSVKDTMSNNRIPCLISNKIMIEENNILLSIKGYFEEISGASEMLDRIIENLNIAVDIPFFFNGDPGKFRWESVNLEFKEDKEKDLLEPFQYVGSHFKAYDETYDLNFEVMISSNMDPPKIKKFPIIASAFTEEKYKKIFQGINITPLFKLKNPFEIQLQLKTY